MIECDKYFMNRAALAAKFSGDTTKVGCIIVPLRAHCFSATNKFSIGVEITKERRQRPYKYLWTGHAEERAIAGAARLGVPTEGATAYVTHYPCNVCARLLVMAGIERVVVGDGKTSMPDEVFQVAEEIFSSAGVEVCRYEADHE